MGEISAHALPLLVNLECCFGGPGEAITELDVVVDPVADGLDAAPAGASLAEEIPGDVAETVGFAVAAGEEELDNFGGHGMDIELTGIEGHGVRKARIADDCFMPEAHLTGGGEDAAASIAEMVGEGRNRNGRRDLDNFGAREASRAGRMRVKHQNHRDGGWKFECEIKTDADKHKTDLSFPRLFESECIKWPIKAIEINWGGEEYFGGRRGFLFGKIPGRIMAGWAGAFV